MKNWYRNCRILKPTFTINGKLNLLIGKLKEVECRDRYEQYWNVARCSAIIFSPHLIKCFALQAFSILVQEKMQTTRSRSVFFFPVKKKPSREKNEFLPKKCPWNANGPREDFRQIPPVKKKSLPVKKFKKCARETVKVPVKILIRNLQNWFWI